MDIEPIAITPEDLQFLEVREIPGRERLVTQAICGLGVPKCLLGPSPVRAAVPPLLLERLAANYLADISARHARDSGA